MLSKGDLDQIRTVVREEVENEVTAAKDEIQSDATMTKILMQGNINEIKDRIKNLEIKTTRMHRELKAEIKLVVNFLDNENVKTTKRVKKIEDRLEMAS